MGGGLLLHFSLTLGLYLVTGLDQAVQAEPRQCDTKNDDDLCASSMLQRRADQERLVVQEHEEESSIHTSTRRSSQAENAMFLMQGTFGPTRESLKELEGKNYKDWILDQINLEPSTLRDYYRARVSPISDPTNQVGFSELPVCAKGSRWQEYALRRSDEGRPIIIADKPGGGKEMLVDGFWRTDLDPAHTGNGITLSSCSNTVPSQWERKGYSCNRASFGACSSSSWAENRWCEQECFQEYGQAFSEQDDCSGGWPGINGGSLAGYVCSVRDSKKGAIVSVSRSRSCRSLIYARNPAIWVSNPGNIDTQLAFESNPRLPGVLFLANDTADCGLTRGSVMRTGGKIYIHEPRMAMRENTPTNPLAFDAANCPAMTLFNEKSCVVLPEDVEGCPLACGSPGEVANEPKEGHLFTVHTVYYKDGNPDDHVDLPFKSAEHRKLGKSIVWTMRALKAKDQLRQRVAWALSQIIVVGSANFKEDRMSEFWLVLYDIFVRNAFGSYIDILRHVTYSPLMGNYLSYMNSRSFDASGSFPDENYAREIMQLFSLGLSMLHPNGTAIIGPDGNDVPTYTNEHIMNFARVFTGFRARSARSNVELWHPSSNWIDPMRIAPGRHDKYPKPSLYENSFLGDGHPLCSDLPAKSFLMAGAKYRFLGYSYDGEALNLESGSSLFGALCGGVEGACAFNAIVELEASLLGSCQGLECGASTLDVVKVGKAYFSYVSPACVYLFFFNGKYVKATNSNWRYCASPETAVAATACSTGCTNIAPRDLTKHGWTCETGKQNWVVRGQPGMTTRGCNNKGRWIRQKSCNLACTELGVGYGDNCSAGLYQEDMQCGHKHDLTTYESAKGHCASRGMSLESSIQGQCGGDGVTYLWTSEACGGEVQVHEDGKVSAHTTRQNSNRFTVAWTSDNAPAAGTYTTTVEVKAAFDTLPAMAQATTTLKVGAVVPEGGCIAGCDGAVKAYGPADIGVDTVFEVSGRYFKNVVSLVHVAGSSFRNPPVFLPPVPNDNFRPPAHVLKQAIEYEVESLLQDIVMHPSTPGSVCKKLIQRFVTSNPSTQYLAAVTAAFRSGAYNGTMFTGKYGDLGATIAAILLHPEARNPSPGEGGLLREPMLKLMHVLRSMEYADVSEEEVVLAILDDRIGQYPFHSPSVFNYFDADFMPPNFRNRKAEPEPEPEPEPAPLFAPEFQIFTPPTAMNFLNGMDSLLKHGVSNCDAGFGPRDLDSGCQRGQLKFSSSNDSTTAVNELNMMLTGGRLSAEGLAIIKRVYETASESERLEKAQQAIFFTPEFNNLGDPKPAGTRAAPTPPPVGGNKDYKAVVMLFMRGGADTFHMLVPLCHLFNEYKDVRGDAAHAQDQLHPIHAGSSQACTRFGLHPDLHFLSDLYETREHAAFISNVGALVEPVTRATLKSKRKCNGMFSHSHQSSAAQTLDCEFAGRAVGVGGRLGDELASLGYKVESFSISGTAKWSGGVTTKTEIIDRNQGSVRFQAYEEWASVIGNITQQKYDNIYCDEYAQSLSEAVEVSNTLGDLLENVTLQTDYPTDSKVAQQLKQVAKLISTRAGRHAERDFFFVEVGGFDTHANLWEAFSGRMVEIDNALASFVAELEAQGTFNDTILLSASDFGRTLTFNGAGTDHGWGGNYFVLGGKVKGKQVLNNFPRTLLPGNEYDAGRGRVIPEYPWESLMVPVAQWLGVTAVETIFPNLANFNRSHHIITQSSLFRA